METTPQTLRDAGIQQAVDHADAVHEAWSDTAFMHLRDYTSLIGGAGSQLTAEMVRFYARDQGLPPPPDGRAWGAVMVKAARSQIIRKAGWTQATDPKSHCNPTTLWEVI